MCILLVFFAKSKRQNPTGIKIILSTIPFENSQISSVSWSNKNLQNLPPKKITRTENDCEKKTVKNSNRFILYQTSWSHKRHRHLGKKKIEKTARSHISKYLTLSASIHHKRSQKERIILPRGYAGNLQKFPTAHIRDFIRRTTPISLSLSLSPLFVACACTRARMVMKYRGTLTRCSVSLICIKREQTWFSAEWFNLGIKAGCGNKRFVRLASASNPFTPFPSARSLFLLLRESYFPSL